MKSNINYKREPEMESLNIIRNRITAVLSVPADLIFFAGHFPGKPILPGVVQIRFVVSVLEKHLGRRVSPVRLSRIKFSSPVSPGDSITIDITLNAERQAIWQIDSNRRTVSRGKLEYCIHESDSGTDT